MAGGTADSQSAVFGGASTSSGGSLGNSSGSGTLTATSYTIVANRVTQAGVS